MRMSLGLIAARLPGVQKWKLYPPPAVTEVPPSESVETGMAWATALERRGG